jgi:hypothetical protein
MFPSDVVRDRELYLYISVAALYRVQSLCDEIEKNLVN